MGEMLGGFFELEWPDAGAGLRDEGPCCAFLHSGRAGLECLLRGMLREGILHGEVLVPRWTCDTVAEPIRRLGLRMHRYAVSAAAVPLPPRDAPEGSLLLLTDAFGLNSQRVKELARHWPGPVVIDATMALFADYGAEFPAFYSFRKWVGVPDGGMACAPFEIPLPADEARSARRMRCMLERLECGAEAALPFCEAAEEELHGEAMRMSGLTRRLLRGIDYERVKRRRRANFALLHEALAPINRLELTMDDEAVPFCYPLLCGIPGLRDELVDAGVALPLFWPEVVEACPAEAAENYLSRSLLPLPIDQRYGEAEMSRLIGLILG